MSAMTWNFDSDEEFLAEYRREPRPSYAYYTLSGGATFVLALYPNLNTIVSVEARNRQEIETVFEVLERPSQGIRDPSS